MQVLGEISGKLPLPPFSFLKNDAGTPSLSLLRMEGKMDLRRTFRAEPGKVNPPLRK